MYVSYIVTYVAPTSRTIACSVDNVKYSNDRRNPVALGQNREIAVCDQEDVGKDQTFDKTLLIRDLSVCLFVYVSWLFCFYYISVKDFNIENKQARTVGRE